MSARTESRVARRMSSSLGAAFDPASSALARNFSATAFSVAGQSPSSALMRSPFGVAGQLGLLHDAPRRGLGYARRIIAKRCKEFAPAWFDRLWVFLELGLQRLDVGAVGAIQKRGLQQRLIDVLTGHRADSSLAVQQIGQCLAESSRRGRDADAGRLHRRNLVLGAPFAAGDDRAGMPHSDPGGRCALRSSQRRALNGPA